MLYMSNRRPTPQPSRPAHVNRNANRTYQRQVMITMAAYTLILILVWPLARSATELPQKVLLALTPVLPLIYVIWLMGRRIWTSDELEQRTHLIGLGAATAVVSLYSLIGGFLAAAKVLSPSTSAALLLFVFPILMICYGGTRVWVARQYGGDAFCEDDEGMPLYLRLLLCAAVFAAIAVWALLQAKDDMAIGVASGAAATLGVAAVLLYLRRRRKQRRDAAAE